MNTQDEILADLERCERAEDYERHADEIERCDEWKAERLAKRWYSELEARDD